MPSHDRRCAVRSLRAGRAVVCASWARVPAPSGKQPEILVSNDAPTASKSAEKAETTDTAASKALNLDSSQRRHLRSLAHPLKPIVFVGEGGIGPAVTKALDDALESHELVKVRLRQPNDKKAAARELAEASAAALCGVVGHTVVLYRPNSEEPRIKLPTKG